MQGHYYLVWDSYHAIGQRLKVHMYFNRIRPQLKKLYVRPIFECSAQLAVHALIK